MIEAISCRRPFRADYRASRINALLRATTFACLSACLLLTAPVAYAQVPAAEREALIRFYQANGGDDWSDNSLWLAAPGTECDWQGVQCAGLQTGSPFVLRLMLPDNNLKGRLPDSLAELEGLRTLSLGGNQLEGTIPPDLWGLSSLTDLLLQDNRFSGQAPAAILAMPEGMPRTLVILSGNRIDGFETSAFPDSSPGTEIRLNLADNLIEELPPVSWRETGAIGILDLSGNRIEGSLALGDAPWPGLEVLDLSGNAVTELSGPAAGLLPDLESLDLNRNRISELPAFLAALEALTVLDVGNNRLAGELPEWFAGMSLASLGLDNNDLAGPIAGVFEAMDLDNFPRAGPHGALGLRLHVANNRFSGPLPAIDFSAFNSPAQGQSPEFGLDLCFNDIELPDAATVEIIESVHRGLALTACLGREQAVMEPAVSGSWYKPARSGEGLTQMLLDDGRVLSYWFTYTLAADDEPRGQKWLFDVTEPGRSWSEHRPLWTTAGGRFGQGLKGGRAEPSRAWMRQNLIDADNQHFFYNYRGPGFCITGACFWEILTERFDLVRLSGLAGTTCDNQDPNQWISGAWYDPDRDGEGFVVEVIEDGRALVYWFTYAPDGSGEQAWVTGVGDARIQPILAAPPPGGSPRVIVEVDELIQPTGGVFGPDFDPDAIDRVPWGNLRMEFFTDNTGQVFWDSLFEDFGAGDHPLFRLARPLLADCPED